MSKDGKLRAVWSKKERDVMYHYPRSCDGSLLHSLLGHTIVPGTELTFLKELERRGYDLTTLKFSIERNPTTPGDEHE